MIRPLLVSRLWNLHEALIDYLFWSISRHSSFQLSFRDSWMSNSKEVSLLPRKRLSDAVVACEILIVSISGKTPKAQRARPKVLVDDSGSPQNLE
jgi:hypothetical protein